jgi:hypothetical protein
VHTSLRIGSCSVSVDDIARWSPAGAAHTLRAWLDRRGRVGAFVDGGVAMQSQGVGDFPGMSPRDAQRAREVLARNGFVVSNEHFERSLSKSFECLTATAVYHTTVYERANPARAAP